MQLTPHPPEKRAEAKLLGETTLLSCTAIGERIDVKASTVRSWKISDGWKRPPGAPARRSFEPEELAAVVRMREGGARFADIARASQRHPDTVARAARHAGAAAAGPAAPAAAAALVELAPEEAARVREALAAGGPITGELLALVRRALGFAMLDLMSDRLLPADRRVQALARTAVTIKALPDDAPAAGASVHDHPSGPATFEEYNALLEELARGFAGLGPAGETAGTPGAPAGPEAAAPQ